MKLNTLNAKGHKYIRWCGPSALAIITGRTLRYCHNMLASIADKKPQHLKGVHNWMMASALNRMGFEMHPVDLPLNLTLRQYIEEHQRTEEFRGVCLINVTRHYVVAHRGLICDNKDPEPKPPMASSSGRKRIDNVWLIKRIPR